MNDYALGVRRYGGPNPYRYAEGGRCHLDQTEAISIADVETDGLGNIVEMPLLRRKPCFGRVERLGRALEGEIEAFHRSQQAFLTKSASQIGKAVNKSRWTPPKCVRCPKTTGNACAEICDERLESAPEVRRRYHKWFEFVENLPVQKRFIGAANVLWQCFLRAIEEHGGWTNVNDERIKIAAIEHKKAKGRKDAERKKANKKLKRQHPCSIEKNQDFICKAHEERDRRAEKLLELRAWKKGPTWIKSLKEENCERVADVWLARTLIGRAGEKVTGGC